MLGIIIPIIVSWYVYKTAKENGRNGILWAVINFVAFFGTQLLVGAAIALIFMIGVIFLGWDEIALEEFFTRWNLLLNFAGLIVGGFASWLVVRHVTRVPEERFQPLPPPPPKF